MMNFEMYKIYLNKLYLIFLYGYWYDKGVVDCMDLLIRRSVMNIDIKQMSASLDDLHKRWDTSGVVIVTKNDALIYDTYTGYANREKQLFLNDQSRYNFDALDDVFVRMVVMHLVDKKKVKLSDTLDQYIPELKDAEVLTIDLLFKQKSGLKDYYHDFVMVDFENDAEHEKRDLEEKKKLELHSKYDKRSFEQVFDLIKDEPYKYKPDQNDVYSATTMVLLAEVVKRVTGKTTVEYLVEDFLKPVGIEATYGIYKGTQSCVVHKKDQLINMPNIECEDGIFSLSKEDLNQLMLAFSRKDFYSKSMWKKLMKLNQYGEGYVFGNAGGYHCFASHFLGYSITLYLNFSTHMGILSYNVEMQQSKYENSAWTAYRPELRQLIASFTTFPENTKMVKLTKKIFWDALNLKLKPGQEEFVLPAKESVAMSLMYKTKTGFVQMEGNVAVGFLVLGVDKKKEDYQVDIILIDKKYQGRGYGKQMVSFAVDYLKEAGAKKLGIGVARENIAAKKIYSNAGFKPKSVYDGGMYMEIDLEVDNI